MRGVTDYMLAAAIADYEAVLILEAGNPEARNGIAAMHLAINEVPLQTTMCFPEVRHPTRQVLLRTLPLNPIGCVLEARRTQRPRSRRYCHPSRPSILAIVTTVRSERRWDSIGHRAIGPNARLTPRPSV